MRGEVDPEEPAQRGGHAPVRAGRGGEGRHHPSVTAAGWCSGAARRLLAKRSRAGGEEEGPA